MGHPADPGRVSLEDSMKNSSHRRWKGHCLLCAFNRGKVKGLGRSRKDPFSARKAAGKNRRLGRNYVGDYEI